MPDQREVGAGVLPYLMLLIATTSLGIGFVLAVPALDTFAAPFGEPQRRPGPEPERLTPPSGVSHRREETTWIWRVRSPS